MKTKSAAKINRTNPEVAGAVISTLLAEAGARPRRAILRFLAESIEEAARSNNERWGVTLEPGFVRLNVGQVESVVLWPNSINVLVTGKQPIASTTLNDPYPAAGGSRLRFVPHTLATLVLPSISAAHLEAKALARRRPCTRVIKDAHSPGVVEFLWAELGLRGTPPVPTHYGQRSAPFEARATRSEIERERRIDALPDLAETETTAIRKLRLAQQLFKARLRAADGRCRVTGIADQQHLRASHIKPWAVSTDRERQDPANGLLLAPHVDHLFDAGFVSFEDDGTVLVSKTLDRAVLEAWGLDQVKRVAAFSAEQARYLRYHRAAVFKRG